MKKTKSSSDSRLCKVSEKHLHKSCVVKKRNKTDSRKQIRHLLNVENRLKYECRYDTDIKAAKIYRKVGGICARCGRYSGRYTLCRSCRNTWKQICELIDKHPELRDPVHISRHLCLSCHHPVDAPYRQTCNKCRKDYKNGKHTPVKLITNIPKFTEDQIFLQDKLFADSERRRRLNYPVQTTVQKPAKIIYIPSKKIYISADHPLAQFLPSYLRYKKTDVPADSVTRRSTRRDIEYGSEWEIEQRGQCFSYLQNH